MTITLNLGKKEKIRQFCLEIIRKQDISIRKLACNWEPGSSVTCSTIGKTFLQGTRSHKNFSA